MEHAEIQDYALRLMEAHGTKSIAEAAEKARHFEETGDPEQARDWRQIQQVLLSLRGPRVS